MQAVIIAAGESSRFWPFNQGHKTQVCVLGKPLIYWTMKGLADNGVKNIVVVCKTGSSLPEMLNTENDLGVSLRFAFQQEPLGTGNALWQAKDYIKESFFALWPNKVNSSKLAKDMKNLKETHGSQAVLVGAETQNPWDYGIAQLEGDRLLGIQENPEPGSEPSRIKVIGFYFLEPDFFGYYEKLGKHHEADLIEAVNLYLKDKKASLVMLDKDVPALKYPWELLGILDILLHSENFKPGIHETAKIGSNVIIKGEVHIGANTIIKDNTIIEGPCFIGENCEIGYSNVLRGPLDIEKGVKTGAFFEAKHSIIQEGTSFHSGYVGDSIIGKNCKFGAGFISANRRLDRQNILVDVKGKKVDTGTSFLGVVAGEESSFGIQSGTMPGILIGKGCKVGPGVKVFKDLQDGETLRSE